jgi:hypothetical protein
VPPGTVAAQPLARSLRLGEQRGAAKIKNVPIIIEINPNSEVEVECGAAAQGAHAAGVQFSAARRKSRPTNFLAPKSDKECERRFGRTAQTGARAACATIPISEFGINRPKASRECSVKDQKAAEKVRGFVGK